MMNTEEKEYNTGHSVGGAPRVSIVILKTNPNERKSITKRYPDGRTLTLLVIDDRLVEKSLAFCWDWDYELIREEKERGKSVSFKFWKKGELEVGLSYFGTYLFGKMFTLDFTEILTTNLVAYSWRDELLYDIAFPMVDVKKIRLEDGFSSTEKEDPFMKELMHDMVVDALNPVCSVAAVRASVCGSRIAMPLLLTTKTNTATRSPSSTRPGERSPSVTCLGSSTVARAKKASGNVNQNALKMVFGLSSPTLSTWDSRKSEDIEIRWD
jgi:hypothetical protein